MELTVVGSGTAAPDPERAGAGFFIRHRETTLLLDCGPGVVHHLARFGVPWTELDHLAISHFHTDHIGDLAALLFGLKHGTAPPRRRPLSLWGPAGLRDRVHALAAAFGDYVLEPGFPLQIVELEPGRSVDAGELRLTAYPTPHTDASCGYRVEAAAGSLAYTGDTAFSERLASAFAGVDLLIAECSVPDESPVEGHLTPSSLAAFAAVAGPGTLLVTHVYPQLAVMDVPGLIRRAGWDGNTRRASDGLRLTVPPAD